MKKFIVAAFFILISTTLLFGEEFSVERESTNDFINYKTYEHAEQLVGQSSKVIQGRLSYEFTIITEDNSGHALLVISLQVCQNVSELLS